VGRGRRCVDFSLWEGKGMVGWVGGMGGVEWDGWMGFVLRSGVNSIFALDGEY